MNDFFHDKVGFGRRFNHGDREGFIGHCFQSRFRNAPNYAQSSRIGEGIIYLFTVLSASFICDLVQIIVK